MQRKLLKYANGDEYIVGGIAGIFPNGIEPVEEIDLTVLSDEDFKALQDNPKNQEILDKLNG